MLFSTLEKLLGSEGRVTFTLSGAGNGSLVATVTPVLPRAADNLDESAQQLRAALATPLVIRGTAEALDSNLVGQLEDYAATHQTLERCQPPALTSLKTAAARACQQQTAGHQPPDSAKETETCAGKDNDAVPTTQDLTVNPTSLI